MLKINKDYKCPSEEQLEQEWIDWGNLLVDDLFSGKVERMKEKLDENDNIEYGGLPVPIEVPIELIAVPIELIDR